MSSASTSRPGRLILSSAGDGVLVFEGRGFGPEDIEWIRRDQFLYFVELEHALTGTDDWVALRVGSVDALAAALGLQVGLPLGDPTEPTVWQRCNVTR